MAENIPPKLAPSIGTFLSTSIVGFPLWIWIIGLAVIVLLLKKR